MDKKSIVEKIKGNWKLISIDKILDEKCPISENGKGVIIEIFNDIITIKENSFNYELVINTSTLVDFDISFKALLKLEYRDKYKVAIINEKLSLIKIKIGGLENEISLKMILKKVNSSIK